MNSVRWKSDWEVARQHHSDWWNHKGLVVGMWGNGFSCTQPVHARVAEPEAPADLETGHTDSEYISARLEFDLSRKVFPADVLPIGPPGIGTVELAPYLRARVTFQEDTVWYHPVISDPDDWPILQFDPDNVWYRRMEKTLRAAVERADGRYIVGLPAISPNLDVLAELRGTGELMTDFFDRPEWVKGKLDEIDQVFFEVHSRMYDIIRLPDGSSSFYYFMLLAPGRVTQLQGDVAAMISEDMFREFMMPGLTRVADEIDYTMFHVDGPDMIKHVDALCEIESLDAIEFTPGPGVPRGGSPHWYDLYRSVLASGKSIQVVWLEADDVLPLLDAIGTDGIYLMVECDHPDELAELEQKIRG